MEKTRRERFWALVDVAQRIQGLTDEDLAGRLGWHRTVLSRKKSGVRVTSWEDVDKVTEVLPEVKVSMTVDVSALTDNRQYHRPTSTVVASDGHVA